MRSSDDNAPASARSGGATSLAADLAAGSHAAFVDVYLSTVRDVHQRARRAVGPGEAEDAVSVVFLEVWRLRHKAVAVEDSLAPWVFAVAEYCFRGYRRATQRHHARLERWASAVGALSLPADGNPWSVSDHADAVASRFDAQRDADTFERALRSLPEPLRKVATRCLVDGVTSAQVAAELGSSASTVRGQLSSARRLLASAMRQMGEHPDSDAGDGRLPAEGPPRVLRDTLQTVGPP